MQSQSTDLLESVQADRAAALKKAEAAAAEILRWTQVHGARLPLHRFEGELWPLLMAFGTCLVAVWWSCRLPVAVPRLVRQGRGRYLLRGLAFADVRTRFGTSWLSRPIYDLVSGSGPRVVSPVDRLMGLAGGRMSLGVHLLTAWLVARTTFDDAIEVQARLTGYAPSKRSSLGIVDSLGPVAARFLDQLPPPEGDGEILVISCDDKAAPMISAGEHAKRCKPHRKRKPGESKRVRRKLRRKENRKPRRKQGDKSKNGRSAKLATVYTLRVLPDGSVEGPINRRVLGTFGRRSDLVARLVREAIARGYPNKRTIFLADGASTLWDIWKKHFPKAEPCLDWYHLCEYLWAAGGAVHKERSKALTGWVKARQNELREGKVEAVLIAIESLRDKIGSSGPGTKGRRKRVNEALQYIDNHRNYLNYAALLKDGLDIGTGVMEGAVKHAVAARLDGSGMRWSPQRAEHVLALRLLRVNDIWDEFEEHAAMRHEAEEAWTVPRITPEGPQNVDPACLEAA